MEISYSCFTNSACAVTCVCVCVCARACVCVCCYLFYAFVFSLLSCMGYECIKAKTSVFICFPFTICSSSVSAVSLVRINHRDYSTVRIWPGRHTRTHIKDPQPSHPSKKNTILMDSQVSDSDVDMCFFTCSDSTWFTWPITSILPHISSVTAPHGFHIYLLLYNFLLIYRSISDKSCFLNLVSVQNWRQVDSRL